MTAPLRGLGIIALLLLQGCSTAMTAQNAQHYAAVGLNRYCRDSGPCGAWRVTGAQRLNQGWLVDFEAPAAKYGVFVHDNRQTDVSVWKKNP